VDTIFKTLRVKATTVSVRLRIYLCALKIPTPTNHHATLNYIHPNLTLLCKIQAWGMGFFGKF
jgi:hypothetical protein